MAVAQQEVFEEHLGVIAALKDNYTRRDDEVTIQSLHDMKAELDHLCAAREDDAKSIIKEFARRVEEAETSAKYPESEEAHAAKVAQLQNGAASARDGVERLTQQLQELQTQRECVKAQLDELQSKQQALQRILDNEVPYVRHKISLYAAVTKLNWDLGQLNRIAGFIKDPTCKFDFGETSGYVSADHVNKLWKLIDEQCN